MIELREEFSEEMTIKDAIFNVEEIIVYTEKIFNLKDEHKEALKIALEAMWKQIPKKFKMIDDYTHVCPVCGEAIRDMKWCNNCGQKLDLGEEG